MTLKSIRQKTIKRLFAVSGNQCYFPNCKTPLVDEESGTVTGEICHIKGRKSGSPRYDPNQSDEERHGFDNLLLICPFHHKVIDDDPNSYTISRLNEIKVEHEKLHAGGEEPSNDIADKFLLNISKGSAIFTQDQKGGQVAHSIINIGYEDKTRLIQAFFNRVVLFVERLIESSVSDKILINIIGDFSNSDLKHIFGMAVSQTRKGFDNTVEFLNGRYVLRIEMYVEGKTSLLFKDNQKIDLSNPITRYQFYEDLQNFSTLTTGFQPSLPNNLKNQKERIISAQKSFNTLLRMFKKLYIPSSKISQALVEIIHKSDKMREYFGISAPKPTQLGIPIDDVPIHFLDGKYRLIPNSATLRIENDAGQYDDLLSKNSPAELIGIELSEFFKNITEYTKSEHDIDLNFSGTIAMIAVDQKGFEIGYCIRCGTNIEFNPSKPYCYNCFKVWAEYYNTEFVENRCHKCGEYYQTTINKPLCNKCY